jgi:hypothetical protein
MTKEISRIELFCDDTSVGRIQRMLTQIKGVYDVKAVPVVNAAVKTNGHVKAISGGNMAQQFIAHMAKTKTTVVTPGYIKAWLEKQGRSPGSYNYVLKLAVQAGILKQDGGGTTKSSYTVHMPKALPAPRKVKNHA